MGVTVHYRGTIDDLNRIEEFEDRVMATAFALGGKATVWRSFADHDRSRVIRGLIVEMSPGQESLSLLVSPEGHFTPLCEIEEAERSPFVEPSYCFIKTQFGSVQGHIAVVHLLLAIKDQFCSNLKIMDEAEYPEHRDPKIVARKIGFVGSLIKEMAQGLRDHGLNKEAAEDENIVVSRIERIARLVHQKMSGQDAGFSRSAQTQNDSTDQNLNESGEQSLENEVATMQRIHRENQIRSERMSRGIEEAIGRGQTAEEALEFAFENEGLAIPKNNAREDEPENEGWQPASTTNEGELEAREDQNAVLQGRQLLETANQHFDEELSGSNQESFTSVLSKGACDILGGLAQATSCSLETQIDRALAITQLSRALKGHGFARGALIALRGEQRITKEQFDDLHEQLATILESIHSLVGKAWDSGG